VCVRRLGDNESLKRDVFHVFLLCGVWSCRAVNRHPISMGKYTLFILVVQAVTGAVADAAGSSGRPPV